MELCQIACEKFAAAEKTPFERDNQAAATMIKVNNEDRFKNLSWSYPFTFQDYGHDSWKYHQHFPYTGKSAILLSFLSATADFLYAQLWLTRYQYLIIVLLFVCQPIVHHLIFIELLFMASLGYSFFGYSPVYLFSRPYSLTHPH